MQCHGVTFDLGSARMFSTAISETHCSYHKDMWFVATNDYMYFHLTVLFPLTDIFQLINFTAS